MKRLVWTSAVAFVLALAAAARGEDTELLDGLRAAFEPARPAVTLSYDVSYRVLFLRIARLARATIESVEGHWRNQVTGERVPAFLLQFRFDSLDNAESQERGRISVHRRILIALRKDDLDTLVYAKQADEVLNPLFLAKQQTRYFEIYDFQSGSLAFRRQDHLTGTVQTNLIGGFDLARQGREVGTTLQVLADVHDGRRGMLTRNSPQILYVNICGVVTPFAMTTVRGDLELDFAGGTVSALKADIVPAPEAGGRGKPVALWVAPFRDIARRAGDGRFEQAVADAPEWSMVPLIADYGLAIGYVRGQLREMDVAPRQP